MLTFLLGDMLRLFSGDIMPSEIDGEVASQAMWLGAEVIMLIPIIMIVLSLTVGYRAIRWVSIVVSVFFVVFNLVSLGQVLPAVGSRMLGSTISGTGGSTTWR